MVHETLSIVYASIMILIALIIIVLNIRVGRMLRKLRDCEKTVKTRKVIMKAKHVIKTGMLTPVELILLANEAMMTSEQVRQTYVSERVEPLKTMENIFGGLKNEFFSRFCLFSRFLEVGIAHESLFLSLKSIEDPSYSICPTQEVSVQRSERG